MTDYNIPPENDEQDDFLSQYEMYARQEPSPIDEAIKPTVVPFHKDASIEYLQSNTAHDIIEHQNIRSRALLADKFGYTTEQKELAEKCGLLSNDKGDGYVNIPEGLMDNSLIKLAYEASRAYQFPFGTTALVALSAFSAVSSLAYCVEYYDGKRIPLGLYLCAGQPPGASKSRTLDTFMDPLQEHLSRVVMAAQVENDKLPKGETPHPVPLNTVSNATPEGLEHMMKLAESGRFVIASAEQGILDRILNIGVTGRSTDNDLVLKGFGGEYHGAARVTRQAYSGKVYGSVTVIAQPESAQKIISSSNGQGIVERFLFANEPTLLGKRIAKTQPLSKSAAKEYDDTVKYIVETFKHREPKSVDDLTSLRFCEKGYAFFNDIFTIAEPVIGMYNAKGEYMMMSALSKVNMQIMKIASILHIAHHTKPSKQPPKIIDFFWLEQATYLCFGLIKNLESVLISEGEMGEDAKESAVIAKFDRKPRLTKRELGDRLKGSKLFPSRTDITDTLDKMVEGGVLKLNGNSYSVN